MEFCQNIAGTKFHDSAFQQGKVPYFLEQLPWAKGRQLYQKEQISVGGGGGGGGGVQVSLNMGL